MRVRRDASRKNAGSMKTHVVEIGQCASWSCRLQTVLLSTIKLSVRNPLTGFSTRVEADRSGVPFVPANAKARTDGMPGLQILYRAFAIMKFRHFSIRQVLVAV